MPSIRSQIAISCAMIACASFSYAATPGYVETFETGLNGWGSNPSVITHVLTNGADGPSDPFAMIEGVDAPTELLIRASASTNPDVTGNYTAAGITQISFELNELGIDDGLAIRIGFGSLGNFWVSNQIFDPSANTWEQYTIDLVEANFTEVFGGLGTFDAAMSNAQRIQFRLDFDAPGIMPDVGQGDFGLDNVTLIPTPASASIVALGGAVMARRRRR